MSKNSSAVWAARVRFLGISGGVLALLSALCGVLMLIMKWQVGHAPNILSQIPLLILPLAFIAFIGALICAVIRRRTS